jgi:integrase
LEQYPNESRAQAAADAQRLTINQQSPRNDLRHTTVNTLWEHYSNEELPLKEISTQDAYTSFVKNWILPRWGNLLLEKVKTVEVERWLRAADRADGTRAKIKYVMSALFSHAVRWEFCSRNPISSGIPVGKGGARGPSTGGRISAKRQRSPLVLTPEQMKLGLAELEFRDQLLVFLIGALGTRRGEVGGLRWLDCDFEHEVRSIRRSSAPCRSGRRKASIPGPRTLSFLPCARRGRSRCSWEWYSSARSSRRLPRSASRAWAGTPFGTPWGRCWRRWASIS